MDAVNMDWTQCNPSNHMTWDFELLGYAPTEANAMEILESGETLIVSKGEFYEVHKMYGRLICITTYRHSSNP